MTQRTVLCRFLWLSGAVAAFGGGCGDDDNSAPCSAGDERPCTCPDGSVGTQECDGDGPLWLPCSCDDGDTGGSSGTGGSGGLCTNSCPSRSDGSCDDGGPGSDRDYCAYGTDCDDCGPRFALSGGGSGGSGTGGSGTGGSGTGGSGTGGSGTGGDGTGGGGTGGGSGGSDSSGGAAGTAGAPGGAGTLAGAGGAAGSAGLAGGGAAAGSAGTAGGVSGLSGAAGNGGTAGTTGAGGSESGGAGGDASGGVSGAGAANAGGAGGATPGPGGSFDFETDLEGWSVVADPAGLCSSSNCATHATDAGYDAVGSVELVVPFSGASEALSFGYDLPQPQDLSGRVYSVWVYADSGALDNPASRQPSIEIYALSGASVVRAAAVSVFPAEGQWFELTFDFDADHGASGFDAGDVRQIGITVTTPVAGTTGTLTIYLDTVVY